MILYEPDRMQDAIFGVPGSVATRVIRSITNVIFSSGAFQVGCKSQPLFVTTYTMIPGIGGIMRRYCSGFTAFFMTSVTVIKPCAI